MTRRTLLRTGLKFSFPAIGAFLAGGWPRFSRANAGSEMAGGVEPLVKLPSEWRELLPRPAYSVLFQGRTERPGSSPLNMEKQHGTFVCAACFLPLFESKTKFESGTGWPSFWAPIEGHVATKVDYWMLVPRTEYHCARCGGHQGHVFADGPPPTGKRWCNNGVALNFVPEGKALPELRT